MKGTNVPGAEFEEKIQSSLRQGRMQEAATILLGAYSGEIQRFLVRNLRDTDAAHEAFSCFCLDMWRGMPGPKQNARAWAYQVARNAMRRVTRKKRVARDIVRRLQDEAPPESNDGVRVSTRRSARTTTKERVRSLRQQLGAYEQWLLDRHVDRGLTFREVALSTLNADASTTKISRETARLRKRYQLIKQKLCDLALKAGLFGDAFAEPRKRLVSRR